MRDSFIESMLRRFNTLRAIKEFGALAMYTGQDHNKVMRILASNPASSYSDRAYRDSQGDRTSAVHGSPGLALRIDVGAGCPTSLDGARRVSSS